MSALETRIPYLPDRINRLTGLATNLWWSWSREARGLFRWIDPVHWHRTRHNPIELLQFVDPGRLIECSQDPTFLEAYDRVCGQLDVALSGRDTWFRSTFPEHGSHRVAYFCAEFGLHNSVPIYSGGLGVLAGDHCKAASDLGIPLVGVGLLYTMGYFDQRIRLDGWQEDDDDPLDPTITPLIPLLDESGAPSLVTIPIGDRMLHVGAWRMQVGSVPVYFLDTNLEMNDPQDRSLSLKLYAGGAEMRIRQEWVLGIGGVRLLRKLGIQPAAWHANEGHAAFMLIERVRELVDEGHSLDDAVAAIRASSLFTTHTPVPAGHDIFTRDQVNQCIGSYVNGGALDRSAFHSFGLHPVHNDGTFHMTVAAIRLAGRVNGVSRVHGGTSRQIWRVLWPDRDVEKVPIQHVTNGVHLATWMANQMMDLLDRELETDWGNRLEDGAILDGVRTLDGAALWAVHERLKMRLLEYIREDARRRLRDHWKEPGHLVGAGTLLSSDALTIGYARRFAGYKRAALVLKDPERLRRILVDPRRPVQIVFAGKAHPADEIGKRIVQQVYSFAQDPSFEGRIAFLEDYEMHLAHRLVQGVDLWLNVPRVPMEACGTSGMKAGLNAVPQLGTLDGWWAEGYDGKNGWSIPLGPREEADAHDSEFIYDLLESEIVPEFFDRDKQGVPPRWVDRMRYALTTTLARFSARTMLRRYTQDYYLPAMRGDASTGDPPTA